MKNKVLFGIMLALLLVGSVSFADGTTVLSYKIDTKTAVHLKELAYKLNLKKVFISFIGANGRLNPPIRMSVTESGEKRSYNVADSLTPLIGYINRVVPHCHGAPGRDDEGLPARGAPMPPMLRPRPAAREK